MRDTPRNVRLALALLLACVACVRDTSAQAQGRAAARAQGRATAQGGAAARSKRRAVAVLREALDGARLIEDRLQRASVLTLCADTLWKADEPAARAALARAWEAAVESDEAEFKDEQENGRYGDLPERFTSARGQVLAAAARFDTRMSDAWLGALADWVSRHGGGARDEETSHMGADLGPLNEFTRDGQRLALASSLLDEGSYGDAARLVAPAVQGRVNGALVEFLLRLREGSPEEADRLYMQLLAGARAGKDATVNDVLLLSSYALTPRLLAAVNPDGSVSLRAVGGAQDAAAPAAVRGASAHVRSVFFDTAAAVLLLRPVQDAVPGRETHAVYFAIGRLLPFFHREAPRHADALQSRLLELAARLSIERRAALDPQMETHSLSPENPVDPLRRLLDAAAGVGDPKLRDGARLRAVEVAAKRRLWERARGVTEKIEDEETRRAARSIIEAYKVSSVNRAFTGDEDDFEKAAALSHGAEVAPALRAYGLTQAAQMAARRGLRERAAALLEEAFGHASQAETGTQERAAALMMTAAVAARLDSPRAWEALAAAVAALNQDEEFTGERFWFGPEAGDDSVPGPGGALNEALPQFDIREMFDAAARLNFDRAVAEARNLKSAGARARALVAAARVELERLGVVPGQVWPSH